VTSFSASSCSSLRKLRQPIVHAGVLTAPQQVPERPFSASVRPRPPLHPLPRPARHPPNPHVSNYASTIKLSRPWGRRSYLKVLRHICRSLNRRQVDLGIRPGGFTRLFPRVVAFCESVFYCSLRCSDLFVGSGYVSKLVVVGDG